MSNLPKKTFEQKLLTFHAKVTRLGMAIAMALKKSEDYPVIYEKAERLFKDFVVKIGFLHWKCREDHFTMAPLENFYRKVFERDRTYQNILKSQKYGVPPPKQIVYDSKMKYEYLTNAKNTETAQRCYELLQDQMEDYCKIELIAQEEVSLYYFTLLMMHIFSASRSVKIGFQKLPFTKKTDFVTEAKIYYGITGDNTKFDFRESPERKITAVDRKIIIGLRDRYNDLKQLLEKQQQKVQTKKSKK